MKVTWQNAKGFSTLALYEVALEAMRPGAHEDVDAYLGGLAALFELVARANAGKVAKDELKRRKAA